MSSFYIILNFLIYEKMLKHGSLIALNITVLDESKNNIVINPVPILYYCAETKNKIESILSDKVIINIIDEAVNKEPHIYSTGLVNFVSFELDSNDEEYIEDSILIQDVLDVKRFKSVSDLFIDKTVKDIYHEVFNADYTNQSNCESIVYDVYSKVSLMYKNNITTDTFINFVRKKLKQSTNLNDKNIQELVDNVEQEIKEKISIDNE